MKMKLPLCMLGSMMMVSLQAAAFSAGEELFCKNMGAVVATSKIQILKVEDNTIYFTYFDNIRSRDGWNVFLDKRSGTIFNNDEMVASGQSKSVGMAQFKTGSIMISQIGYDGKQKTCSK
jgi:hypothetical protein